MVTRTVKVENSPSPATKAVIEKWYANRHRWVRQYQEARWELVQQLLAPENGPDLTWPG